MIIYNVTVKIDTTVQEDWLQWMKEVHIPDVMKTGQFQSHRLCKLLEQDETDGVTYAVQYLATSMERIFTYNEKFAKELQAQHTSRYANKFVVFRTYLRILE